MWVPKVLEWGRLGQTSLPRSPLAPPGLRDPQARDSALVGGGTALAVMGICSRVDPQIQCLHVPGLRPVPRGSGAGGPGVAPALLVFDATSIWPCPVPSRHGPDHHHLGVDPTNKYISVALDIFVGRSGGYCNIPYLIASSKIGCIGVPLPFGH